MNLFMRNIAVLFGYYATHTFDNCKQHEFKAELIILYSNHIYFIHFVMVLAMINGVNASGICRSVWMDEVKDYDTNESKLQQPQVISIQKNF